MTIAKTVEKFVKGGIEEVISYNRSVNSNNVRRKVDGRAESRIIELATSPAPDGYARWTLRLLEEKRKTVFETPVNKDAIDRTLKNALKLHKSEYCCIPKNDAEFAACMEDILDVYEMHYDPQKKLYV